MKFGVMMRFFLSPFYHLSESHLFYNMTSLLWKSVQLETSMGSAEFASMVAVLLGLSQGITLLLSKGLLLLGDDTAYYDQHTVGFSGVLFAMKVVLNSWSDDFVYLHGMVHSRNILSWPSWWDTRWTGLPLIEARIQRARSNHSPDFKRCQCCHLASEVCSESSMICLFSGPHNRLGQGGHCISAKDSPRGLWRCPTCTYDNSVSTDICEMCSTAREGHAFLQRQHHQARGNAELPVDEMRLAKI